MLFSYIKKRLIGLVVVLFGVTILAFIFSNISPVDPAEAFLARSVPNPTEEQIEVLREEMGLNLPIYKQYIHWLGASLKGDLGISLTSRNPVSHEIAKKLPATLIIVAMAMVWIIFITIPISIISAIGKNGKFDHITRGITMLGISIPNFWLGFMLLSLFAVLLPFFKVVDFGSLKSIILPSLTLAIPFICSLSRLLRATLLENLNADYVTYARARGLSNKRIIVNHVLKNAMPPTITVLCQYFGYMIAGSAIVEHVFSWPGLGMHLVSAIFGRDLPTISGCVLVIAFIFVLSNLLADVLSLIINPKMADQRGER